MVGKVLIEEESLVNKNMREYGNMRLSDGRREEKEIVFFWESWSIGFVIAGRQ